jgi:UDPglucose 6-dehydrogenase
MERVRDLPIGAKITLAGSPEEAASGAEALIIATEWPDFAHVDFPAVKNSMQSPLLFDGRNLLDPETMRKYGFEYHGIGRGV